MTAPARTAAFHALRAISTGRTDLPSALAGSRHVLADERDRALMVEIVTGTQRFRRKLDYLVERFARRPLDKIDADLLDILRLSLYQLLHLQRVPASAVVDDAVDLARHTRKTSSTGFVNAVLRATLRARTRLPLPPRPDDLANRAASLAYLGITHSHPEWLVTRWFDRYGFEATERWVAFNNAAPRLTLRVNTLRGDRESVAAMLRLGGVTTQPTSHASAGLVVVSGNPLRLPHDGLFFIQDEASQIVASSIGAKPGERVLDLCASPGGKTTAMAADMHDHGLVVACDVRSRRVRLLQDTVRLSQAAHIRVVHVAASGPLPFHAGFDRVLVDAPCSGLGTVRRDPDIKWRRSDRDVLNLAGTELELLIRASDTVKPGGRLVYATCSSEREENEDVVNTFLEQKRGFALFDLRRDSALHLTAFLDDRAMLRTLPFAHGLEAFFAAALIRNR